jgi:two-component system, OmpR family, phosphate regulon sensor histidine kinase PhoR
MLRRTQWFFHPLAVFIFSILALGLSLVLYIYWYIEVSAGLRTVVDRFQLDRHQVFEPQTWIVILVLSILVGIILVGIFIIFVYSQKALRLYRLQNNFINSFTHELKTPVTSLKLFLETLLKHELPEAERQRYLGYMLTDIGRLGETINRILELARIESKSYAGEFVVADVPAESRRFFEDHRALVAGVEVDVARWEGPPLTARIDRGLFAMVLMNLVTNAVKYNAAARPRIKVEFARNRRWLQVRVTDNGCGLARHELRKIFRKFYQVGRSEDMSARGTGLGLYLVQLIVRLHRGKCHAESPGPGRGATFVVSLPPAPPTATHKRDRPCAPTAPDASSSSKTKPISPKG